MYQRHISPLELQHKADSPSLLLKTEIDPNQMVDSKDLFRICFLRVLITICTLLLYIYMLCQRGTPQLRQKKHVEANFKTTAVKRDAG